LKSRRKCIQRIVLAAPRPESVRESDKICLVDCIQYLGDRALDNLVLQRCDAKWTYLAIRLWDKPPT
jgi:hypothetical protein